jgi:hypothetical protein
MLMLQAATAATPATEAAAAAAVLTGLSGGMRCRSSQVWQIKPRLLLLAAAAVAVQLTWRLQQQVMSLLRICR